MRLSVVAEFSKSQLSSGKYVPVTALKRRARAKLRRDLTANKPWSFGSSRYDMDGFGVKNMGRTRLGKRPDRAALKVGSRRMPDDVLSAETPRGVRAGAAAYSGGRVPGGMRRAVDGVPGGLLDSPETVRRRSQFAAATGAQPGLPLALGAKMPTKPWQQFQLGAHEASHRATRSQLRRGRERNPYRLAQIQVSAAKLGREEARADVEGIRAVRRASGGKVRPYASAYASPASFEGVGRRSGGAGRGNRAYVKLRAKLGEPLGVRERVAQRAGRAQVEMQRRADAQAPLRFGG